jgi:uncharacterized YccA/Bax inhibitor family protein
LISLKTEFGLARRNFWCGYAALGLMVTLIWLYFEILRLLSKLRSRNEGASPKR